MEKELEEFKALEKLDKIVSDIREFFIGRTYERFLKIFEETNLDEMKIDIYDDRLTGDDYYKLCLLNEILNICGLEFEYAVFKKCEVNKYTSEFEYSFKKYKD